MLSCKFWNQISASIRFVQQVWKLSSVGNRGKKGRGRKRQGESRYIDRWTRARYGVVLRIQSEEKGGEKSGGWKLLAMARYTGDPPP